MNLKVNFTNADERKTFADRFKLSIEDGVDHLDVPWHLLNHVNDHDQVTNVEQYDQNTVHEFIVSGNQADIEKFSTIKQTLDNNFFIVSTNNVTELSKHVDSIEITSISAGFLDNNVSSLTTMTVQDTSIDPTGADGQWARIRVASRYRPLLNSYTLHDVNFLSEPELIIMDSGIDFNHAEFQYDGLTFENFYTLPVFGDNFDDDLGHGTAVASMAVGKNLGVGRKCKLVSVKIGGLVNGERRSASLYELGCAIDKILERVSTNPFKTRIVNASWGVTRSTWLDSKFQALIDAGVTVICAAGNQGISVEDISPAGLDTVMTVGSIDKYDIPSGFNNISPSDAGLITSHGLSLDIFAPGENVLIAYDSGYKLSSGTSFSAPLVAGIAAEIAALNEGFLSYNDIKNLILQTSTENALLFEDDRFTENQNRLAYIYTSDSLSFYKDTNLVSYLGCHNPETKTKIVGDINSSINVETYKIIHPDDIITYSIEYYDDDTKNQFGPFISIDPVTGVFTLEYPTVQFSSDTKLRMVEFKCVATTHRIKIESNKMFYFALNPEYQATWQSDVTLALTEINSVSFYAVWNTMLK